MFHSGAWEGFWEADGYDRGWMRPLALRFADGYVEGEGEDVIGSFTFRGTYSAAGQVVLTKQYLGQHAVRYDGQADEGGGLVGRWSIGPDWGGPFALRPLVSALPSYSG